MPENGGGGPVATPDPHAAAVLSDVVARIGGSLDLQRTLQEVTAAVVELLGFGVAVLNLVTPEGDLVVSAMTGPESVRESLTGQRHRKQDWEQLLSESEPRGRLRFVDGRKEDTAPEEMFFWVPDIEVDDSPDSWHPLDALFAPLHAADGRMLGVLSVDLPVDGLRPDEGDCLLLEVFAAQAALAIDHARIHTELQESMRQQRESQAELVHRAMHDSLTGLPNRELLLDRLDHALARTSRTGSVLAVVFLDLDHFKLVNDSLGHLAGDELLMAVARLLQAHLRVGDTAARLGGDEFVLVLEDLGGPAEAIAVAERLLETSREPVVVAGEVVRSSLSVGIAIATAGSTTGSLLAEADTALYRAKAAGRGRWEVFDAAMRAEALAQLALRAELGQALPRGQWRLHYQPIVDLVSGSPLGFEALLRWEHPTRGLLLPGSFLDVLEDSDLDGPVTDWVIETACADAARWPRVGGVAPFVSVNVSPRQLARADLASRVAAVLQRTGLEPGLLWVEITEDRPIDERQDVADVRRLRDLGVRVALDDFGTGYAGLTYLQRLPVDTVKIDRVFVAGLVDDPVSRSIVRAVVGLATVLDLQVVAEGVETVEQAVELTTLGVQIAQGWYFGRPEPRPGPSPVAPPSGAAAQGVRPLAHDLQDDLRRTTRALELAQDVAQVAELAVQAARRLVGADAGAFSLVDRAAAPATLRTVHAAGYPAWAVERFRSQPLDSPLPTVTAAREGDAVWISTADVGEHPSSEVRLARGLTGLAAVPIFRAGEVVGALSVTWRSEVRVDQPVRDHLEALAAVVSSRLDALPFPAACALPLSGE
ncbi:MAG: EAL domain-containing protein [Mycobacteriales bacterium]|nr:EAL domain-containing protein [Mycobacteriales bacterium]